MTGNESGVVSFTCIARGAPAPSITWSVTSGGRIGIVSPPAVTDGDGFSIVNSILTISNLTRSDAGDYTCTASNTVMGVDEMEIITFTLSVNCMFAIVFLCSFTTLSFHVVIPAIIVDPASIVQVLRPAPVTLTCTAEGLPLPTVTWFRTLNNGSEIEFSSVGSGSFTFTNSSNAMAMTVQSNFMINPTVVLDTANYSCMASNTLGNVGSSLSSVSVYG